MVNCPLLSDGDLFLGAVGGSRGTAGCIPPAQLGLRWQSLDTWVGDRAGMYVGQGPALTLLSAAFLGASYLCALSGRGDAPQSCAGTRALSVLGQPQAARVAQRDVGGTGRGQKSQRAQRLGELAQRESCPCALGGRWPGAPGLAPGWGRSARSWGGLEGHAACQQQGDCGQKAPVRPRGGPRLPRLGSEKVAGSGVWPWPSRNEGSLVAVPWGPAAVSISCHTPVAWVSQFFPPPCRIAASPWLHPRCSQPRLGLFIDAKAE